MQLTTSWERSLLPNGLKVLYLPKPSDLTLRLCFAIDYGAHDDPADKAGLAHMVEHMLNAGSRRRIKNAERIELLGGSYNVYTWADFTLACAHVPCDKMVDSSKVLSEMAFDGEFEQTNFQKERKVVLEEIAEQANDPWHRVYYTLMESLFGTHAASRPATGSRETVKTLSFDSIVKTHQRYYHPGNTIVMFIGRYDKAEAEITLNDSWQPARGRRRVVSNKTHFDGAKSLGNEIVKEMPNITQTYIGMGTTTVPVTHPDTHALHIIYELMGIGTTSRLYKEFRIKRGLAYTVTSTLGQGADYGFFAVWAAVKNSNMAKARRLFRVQIERMITEKLSEKELYMGKEMIKGAILRAFDDPDAAPEHLAKTEIFFNDSKAIGRYLTEIQAVDANRVREVAAKYLESERLVTVILKPKGN
jgi:predicted Zn-dependent peptidase